MDGLESACLLVSNKTSCIKWLRNLRKMQMRDYSWYLGKYRMIDERFSIDRHQPLYHWQCPGLAFDTSYSSCSPSLWQMQYSSLKAFEGNLRDPFSGLLHSANTRLPGFDIFIFKLANIIEFQIWKHCLVWSWWSEEIDCSRQDKIGHARTNEWTSQFLEAGYSLVYVEAVIFIMLTIMINVYHRPLLW